MQIVCNRIARNAAGNANVGLRVHSGIHTLLEYAVLLVQY